MWCLLWIFLMGNWPLIMALHCNWYTMQSIPITSQSNIIAYSTAMWRVKYRSDLRLREKKLDRVKLGLNIIIVSFHSNILSCQQNKWYFNWEVFRISAQWSNSNLSLHNQSNHANSIEEPIPFRIPSTRSQWKGDKLYTETACQIITHL